MFRRIFKTHVCFQAQLHVVVCFSAEAQVSKSGQGYSGAPRIQRQEQVIHLSPKKGSQVRLYFTSTIKYLTGQNVGNK